MPISRAAGSVTALTSLSLHCRIVEIAEDTCNRGHSTRRPVLRLLHSVHTEVAFLDRAGAMPFVAHSS